MKKIGGSAPATYGSSGDDGNTGAAGVPGGSGHGMGDWNKSSRSAREGNKTMKQVLGRLGSGDLVPEAETPNVHA